METSFYKKPMTCHLAIHLLLSVAWKDHETTLGGEKVKIRRGQIVSGRNRLSDETGLSPQTIRTSLEHLRRAGFLTIESTNAGSIITICKYDEYQVRKPYNQPTHQPSINQQSTSDQPLQNKGYKGIINNIAETDVPAPSKNGCPYEQIKDLYHQILPELPAVRVLTTKRKSHLKARWVSGLKLKDGTCSSTLEFWERFFNFVRESDFLMGKRDPPPGRARFSADLEWLTKESNFIKVLESKYHK